MKRTATNSHFLASSCALLLVTLLPGASALAQKESRVDICGHALKKDVLTTISTDQQRYSYFSQIDQITFKELKVLADAEASIPLLGDMVNILAASASYSQFEQKRTEFFSKVGYSRNLDRELRDLRVVTAPIAYRYWDECVRNLSSSRGRVEMWTGQEDAETVLVRIRNGLPVGVKLYSDLFNGSVQGEAPGRAFEDGKELGAGEEIPVLLHRLPDAGTMKLSVQTDPGVRGLFVESDWSSAPENVFTGTLALTFGWRERQDRGEVVGRDPWRTRNLHDVDCEHSPCSSDGKFQMARNTVWVNAQTGYRLENPRATCTESGCSWSRAAGSRSCWVVEGGGRAGCLAVEGSRRHYINVKADQYEIVVVDQTDPPKPILLFEQGQFVLEVPAVATGAILKLGSPFTHWPARPCGVWCASGVGRTEPFQFTFNGFLKVAFQGSRSTSDAGLILIRELDERLGLETLIAEHLRPPRTSPTTM